ncbi:YihY/virulence factor BrkB family protein [Clavibacter capsici]|uniref:YihY/virulence factor BrkB family protein n=1 Tax=Clavibacter capsici TaxID=1874630 RepID=A0AAE6XNU0_9MICO|nr:YihY/virulence factor BrkB family protein [Clavibacter capsici]ALD12260.1 ribonuclease [Clavibacter capsici]QIS44377.1 YihY/virulence factor BrkB family protein [Clavibacter capsici]
MTAPDGRGRPERPAPGSPATGATPADGPAPTGIPALIARVMELKPVRVFLAYGAAGGPILAAGMSYQAVFAVFAALAVGFSVAGSVLAGNPALLDSLLSLIQGAVPGLFGEGGAIEDPQALLASDAVRATGIIGSIGLLVTALGWLASTRDSVRRIFELPPPTTFFLWLKVKDLGLALVFALAMVLSAALSVVSTGLLGFVFRLVQVGEDSLLAIVVGRTVGLALVLALDTAVLAGAYRILSGVRIPRPQLLQGALLGGVAMGVLKVLGTALLGGASRNPLLASFAVIIGLLIWFNLICQVILVCASWIAVGMADRGIDARDLTPEQLEAERLAKLDEARRILEEEERARARERYAESRGLTRVLLRLRGEHRR